MDVQVGTEVTLTVMKIPGCAKCHIPPVPVAFGFAGVCPNCGSATPEFSDRRDVDCVVTPEGLKVLGSG